MRLTNSMPHVYLDTTGDRGTSPPKKIRLQNSCGAFRRIFVSSLKVKKTQVSGTKGKTHRKNDDVVCAWSVSASIFEQLLKTKIYVNHPSFERLSMPKVLAFGMQHPGMVFCQVFSNHDCQIKKVSSKELISFTQLYTYMKIKL